MRYLALATDYDGTLAHDGVVDDATIRALERLVHSGRKLILVTGRELPGLESVFPRQDSELADEIAGVERDQNLSDGESRRRVKEMIERKYTAPA
jgi:HAD superfamily hydrolase (TIGR01484 family)